MDVWSAVLRDYLFLSEESIDYRVREWTSFCEMIPHGANLTDAEGLLPMWRAHTRLLPLSECSCHKTLSSSLEGVEYIPPSLFVDYPLLGVILALLVYFLRLYHGRQHVAEPSPAAHGRYLYQPGDDLDSGPQLLR